MNTAAAKYTKNVFLLYFERDKRDRSWVTCTWIERSRLSKDKKVNCLAIYYKKPDSNTLCSKSQKVSEIIAQKICLARNE